MAPKPKNKPKPPAKGAPKGKPSRRKRGLQLSDLTGPSAELAATLATVTATHTPIRINGRLCWADTRDPLTADELTRFQNTH